MDALVAVPTATTVVEEDGGQKKKIKKQPKVKSPDLRPWCLYVLVCLDQDGNIARNSAGHLLTYTGVTPLFTRRLRKHRKEIAGGALRTTRHVEYGTWTPCCVVESPTLLKNDAMSWETLLKPKCAKRRRVLLSLAVRKRIQKNVTLPCLRLLYEGLNSPTILSHHITVRWYIKSLKPDTITHKLIEHPNLLETEEFDTTFPITTAKKKKKKKTTTNILDVSILDDDQSMFLQQNTK